MKQNLLKRFYLVATLFYAFFSTSVEAAEADNASTGKSLSSLSSHSSFSLAKRKENPFDNPSAVYTLTSEDIRRAGATSIPEALRLVPGLDVAQIDGNKWAISSRGFNRQFSSKLLVMIDGMNIYTSSFSGILWSMHDYPLEDIERIEVIKGPGGTIWGLNAVDGLINIVTKSAIRTQGAYVSQIVGTQAKSITEARYGGKTSRNDSYRVYGKVGYREGADNYNTKKDAHNGDDQGRAGFRYDITSVKGNSISLFGEYYKGNSESYFPVLNDNNRNDANYIGLKSGLNWNKKFSKGSETVFSAYYNRVSADVSMLRFVNYAIDVDLQHFYDFSRDNQLTWGVGYREVTDRFGWAPVNNNVMISFIEPELTYRIYSALIQDKFAIIPFKLYFTVGSKFSYNDFSGFEYQPSARVAYYPANNQTVWAAVSRGVRIPNRSDNGIIVRFPNLAVISFEGSEKFESEELMSYEAGYRIKPTKKTSVDLSTFYNQYSKLRTFEQGASQRVCGSNVAQCFSTIPTAANLANAETYGFELVTKWQATPDLSLEADYEFIKIDVHLSDNSTDTKTLLSPYDRAESAEGLTPKSQFKFKVLYDVTPNVEFDNIVYYVDNLPDGGSTYGATGLPSYFRFDTRVGYLPTKNLDLSVGVQNLFDQRHSEYKAGLYANRAELGRNLFFKLAWQY